MARILLQNVDVEFPLLSADSRSLRRTMMQAAAGGRLGEDSRHHLILKALRNISLEFNDGDRVGLVGGNGAGKSTLLRLLAGVYDPTRGTRLVEGRTATLLGVGMGMRDDITGWENIRLYGSLMGMSKAEITRLSPEIAEFSELANFLHLPVSTYSAGMRARLAFSIATSFKAQVLLVDEVFGAGDASFTAKAEKRMGELLTESRIVVFASHDDNLMRRFCNKGLLMDQGQMKYLGPIDDVLDQYQKG